MTSQSSRSSEAGTHEDPRLAIIGMAVRLPGADSIEEYWGNLVAGLPSLTHSSRIPPHRPRLVGMNAVYIGSYGRISKPQWFDHDRFGLSRSEALVTDPQQRLLLEVVDAALDSSAIAAEPDKAIGIFAGVGPTSHPEVVTATIADDYGLDDSAIDMANGFQYAAGRVAYTLGLTGPAINVSTACSTGLTGVHLARHSLLAGECDAAVVGVAAIDPVREGYWWVPGGISSSDGICRPFDRNADGTVPADGAAAIVLRPLSRALADGDPILGVVRATALNNDGRKSGFASVDPASQRQLLSRCLHSAGLSKEDVAYVEAHGTGTKLGDSVEWSALRDVYGSADRVIHVGSVKGNIGHTREAAGLASLIKAVLSIQRGIMPPTANFQSRSSAGQGTGIRMEVLSEARPWERGDRAVRRAGVSAFGLGGTNAHVILEEAPVPARDAPGDDTPRVVTIRSHRRETLDADAARLESAIDVGAVGFAAVAYTSQLKAHRGSYRRVLFRGPAASGTDATARMTHLTKRPTVAAPRVAFVFPGLGAEDTWPSEEDLREWPRLAAELRSLTQLARELTGYDIEPAVGRRDRSSGDYLRDLYARRIAGSASGAGGLGEGDQAEGQGEGVTRGQLPVRHLRLLCVEVGLARALRSCGVAPCAVAGHSLGEIAAAVTAGALGLADGVRLTARRAQFLEDAAPGATLVAAASPAELRPVIDAETEISAENSPVNTTLSGPFASISKTREALADADIACALIDPRHAFHSRLLAPAGERLAGYVEDFDFCPPAIPVVSGLTGTWLGAGRVPDGDYWARQIHSRVMFGAALATLGTAADVIAELGPGVSKGWLPQSERDVNYAHLLRSPAMARAWSPARALAELWLNGIDIDWGGVRLGGPSERTKISWPPASLDRVDLSIEPVAGEPGAPAMTLAPDDPARPVAPEEPEEGTAATTLLETLRSIWQRLLPAGRHEPDSDFFESGGDSLLGLRLSTLVSRSAGAAVPHEVLFADTTLGGMSNAIQSWLDQRGREADDGRSGV